MPTPERPSEPRDRARDHSPHEDGSDRRAPPSPREIGGRDGLDPVRYGDWEKNGRCIDF